VTKILKKSSDDNDNKNSLKKKIRVKKNPNLKNYYFFQRHEDAIIKYCSTDDIKERTFLYIKYIEPSLGEMINKIIFTYKFNSLPNIEELKEECKIWIVTVLNKFDPYKGSKAFSYFSVIIKNWFIYQVKKNIRRNKNETSHEAVSTELENMYVTNYLSYEDIREKEEFWYFLLNSFDDWKYEFEKENEKSVVEAIKILFNNIDSINIFNKKAVYLYIRELTGLNTKQIVGTIHRIRSLYNEYRDEWKNGEI